MIGKALEQEKCDWRMMLWQKLLRTTPARVVIDKERQCYRVEDGSFRNIYADDIEDTEINTIVKEWAEQIKYEDRKKFVKTFSGEKLIEAFEDQRRGISLVTELEGNSGEMIVIIVRFGRLARGMIIEFTFQTIHVNAE